MSTDFMGRSRRSFNGRPFSGRSIELGAPERTDTERMNFLSSLQYPTEIDVFSDLTFFTDASEQVSGPNLRAIIDAEIAMRARLKQERDAAEKIDLGSAL